LFYYGLLFLKETFKKINHLHIILIIVTLSALYLFLSFQAEDVFLAANVWSRYIFGVPGTMLTALSLIKHGGIASFEFSKEAKKRVLLLGYVIFIYGILAGIIVPAAPIGLASLINQNLFLDTVGIPVQLFRAFCAVIASGASISLLVILKNESHIHMMHLSEALAQSGDSAIITDIEGSIIYVNPAFEKQTGYSFDEAYGQKPSIVKSGVQPQEFYKQMWEIIRKGNVFQDRLINKRKNGEMYYEIKTISPIRNEKGKITSFVGMGRDITEFNNKEIEFQTMFETAKDGLAILDLESRFIKFNDAYTEISGFSKEEL
jgi:PAS domain S-box-containing protein